MSLDDLVDREISRRTAEVEERCRQFVERTGLPVDQITLVHYKSKMWPQWKGAVDVLGAVPWAGYWGC